MLKSKIIFLIFFLSSTILVSGQNNIKHFVENNSSFILKRAHLNSTFISDSVKVEETDESNFDYKCILTIKYKGFIKYHSLKCYIYFDDGPKKFIWGIDSNWFKTQTDKNAMVEELKELWLKFIKNKYE